MLIIIDTCPLMYQELLLTYCVWERKELSQRDRSLITVASLITGGNTEQLTFHLNKAKENGISEEELKEVIIHLAFYAGWPKSMSAMMVAKKVFSEGQ
ncbi:hypothetical protein ASD40_22195 [Paenibacillus sp. Root444D2]|nr:hypothetical protein ASD40_22195 [Paenibacillus sp. Root444D2]KRE33014.1 hypothetical protein ASG85_16050 [Paenibacillus sp. Soil724D2]